MSTLFSGSSGFHAATFHIQSDGHELCRIFYQAKPHLLLIRTHMLYQRWSLAGPCAHPPPLGEDVRGGGRLDPLTRKNWRLLFQRLISFRSSSVNTSKMQMTESSRYVWIWLSNGNSHDFHALKWILMLEVWEVVLHILEQSFTSCKLKVSFY